MGGGNGGRLGLDVFTGGRSSSTPCAKAQLRNVHVPVSSQLRQMVVLYFVGSVPTRRGCIVGVPFSRKLSLDVAELFICSPSENGGTDERIAGGELFHGCAAGFGSRDGDT